MKHCETQPLATVVIVGTGQGGFQTALSLSELGFTGRVVLLGDERELPYQRPPLSKDYLGGKADPKGIRLRPQRFYAEHQLELRVGERAAAIYRGARQVVLTSGERLPYDHLVLAIGARNRALPVPGDGLDGVFQLRSLAEAEALRPQLDRVQRVAVVGAGFIGLEFAAVAAAGERSRPHTGAGGRSLLRPEGLVVHLPERQT